MFNDYLERWKLEPDGEPIVTATSRLLPVQWNGVSAMLKIALVDEEKRGGALMSWWNGEGAARILAYEGNAALMERAQDKGSLVSYPRNQRDDEASGIICEVLLRLHIPRDRPPPALVSLKKWFEALGVAADLHGGLFRTADIMASELLASQHDIVVLHGDMHHGNILNFGPRGWLAIDPKGLIGERYFDYANIFCNPDIETATMPGRLARQIVVVTEAAQLESRRLLGWIVAWAGLSAAFHIEDGLSPHGALRVAELAVEALKL